MRHVNYTLVITRVAEQRSVVNAQLPRDNRIFRVIANVTEIWSFQRSRTFVRCVGLVLQLSRGSRI